MIRSGKYRAWRATAAVLALAAMAGPAAAGNWWNRAWRYRRVVTVPPNKGITGLPGDDVGVVGMPTGGVAQPDGRDIRVATASGQLVNSRVLMMGPGDFARVAFALRPGTSRYYVYYGLAGAKAVASLVIRRGVLLEMWAYGGGATSSLEKVQKLFEAPGKVFIGRRFLDRIFMGHNPFGPQSSVASIFTGWFDCPRSGRYLFSCSSRNASFLLVDGKLVVDNSGTHSPQRDIRKHGSVELKAGQHKLTFYHVSRSGDPVVVAAWRPPGESRVRVIPPGAYLAIARAAPGMMTSQSGATQIDFVPKHAGEAFMLNRYFHRYEFAALATGPGASKITWQWDFGDGQTAAGAAVEHVYLLPGLYTVTLKGKGGRGPLKRTNRIFVSRRWDMVTRDATEKLAGYSRIVAGYDFAKFKPELLLWSMLLCRRTGIDEAVMAAGEALMSKDQAPAHVIEQAVPLYAEQLAGRKSRDEAAAALIKAAGMSQNAAVSAAMLVRAARIHLAMHHEAKAEKLLALVLRTYAPRTRGSAVRQARIALGDVWRLRGNYQKARDLYQQAGPARAVIGKSVIITKGDFARHVEAYVKSSEFAWAEQYLDKWEDAYPTDKLEGYSTLLRVRLLEAHRKHAEAAAEAETLADVNPASNYAAELLMHAAKAYRRLGMPAKSKPLLERIIGDYPESAFAAEAKQMGK